MSLSATVDLTRDAHADCAVFVELCQVTVRLRTQRIHSKCTINLSNSPLLFPLGNILSVFNLSHTVEQCAAVAAPGEQLQVRCLAQGHGAEGPPSLLYGPQSTLFLLGFIRYLYSKVCNMLHIYNMRGA